MGEHGTICPECGSQVQGAFCGNCGAAMRASGGDDATHVSSVSSSEHEQPTQFGASAGGSRPYSSYVGANEYANDYAPDRGGYAAMPEPTTGATTTTSSSNGSKALIALVAVVSLAVAAMLGYLFVHKDGDKTADSKSSSSVAPSTPAPTATPSSSSSSASAAAPTQQGGAPAPQQTQQQAPQQAPAPVATQAPAPSASSASSTDSGPADFAGLPGFVRQSGDIGVTREGSTVTIYARASDGVRPISTLHLKGLGGDDKLTLAPLNGCENPILVWNSDTENSSAAFGMDSSGRYQVLRSHGGYDMVPDGGDGSTAATYGVYDKSAVNGTIEYKDSQDEPKEKYNIFDSCNGTTLHWSGRGGI